MRKKKIILIIYMLILILFLCGCSNNEDTQDINKKIQSEIEYLDKEIIGIMNKLNNITLENYEVKSKETVSQKQNEDSGNESSTKSNSSGENSSDNGSNQNSSGDSDNSNDIKVLQMQPSNILVTDKDDIDWVTIKSEIEVIYTSWNSILLDLYSVNVANEDILGFSQTLDNTVLLIKSEDKLSSLQSLANLYSYLPKYANNLEIEESTKNILQTKANILNAYAFVEQENWTEAKNQLNQADNAYTKVTNDVNYIQDKQEEVGRIYVLLKELKNSVTLQDKDIFYIKYKNLMNSIQ